MRLWSSVGKKSVVVRFGFPASSLIALAVTIGSIGCNQSYVGEHCSFGALCVSPGPYFSIVASALTAPADGKTKIKFTLTATMDNGPLVGEPITLVSSRGIKDAISPGSVTTDPNGNATFYLTSTVSGSPTLSILDNVTGSQYPTQSKVMLVGTVPGASTLSSSASELIADSSNTATLTLTMRDSNRNIIPGHGVVLVSVPSNVGTITSSANQTDAKGVIRFVIIAQKSGPSPVTYFAVDSVTGAPIASTFITVSPGKVSASFSTLVAPSTASVGSSNPVQATVTLMDALSNVVPGKTVQLNGIVGGPTISPTASVTDSNGIAKFYVSSLNSGTYSFYAVDNDDGIKLSASKSIQFGGTGSATQLVWASPSPTSAVAGATFSLGVQTQDANGGSVSLPTSASISLTAYLDPSCMTPVSVPVTGVANPNSTSAGLAIFNLKHTKAETIYLKMSNTGSLAMPSPCSSGITVMPGPASQLSFGPFPPSSGAPTAITVGTGFNVPIWVLDASGNPVTTGITSGDTVTITAYSNPDCVTGSVGLVGGPASPPSLAAGAATVSGLIDLTLGAGAVYLKASDSAGSYSSACTSSSIPVTTPSPVISGGLASTPGAAYTYPLTNSTLPLLQGAPYPLAIATDPNNFPITWNCNYKSIGLVTSLTHKDPNYAAPGTPCANLPTLATGVNGSLYLSTVSTTGSTITWTPTSTQRGTFEFSLQPKNSAVAGVTTTLDVTVKENDSTVNMLFGMDALFATGTTTGNLLATTPAVPGSLSLSSWFDIQNLNSSGSITSPIWSGTGAPAFPFALQYNGTSTNMMLGSQSAFNTSSRFAVETWVQPALVSGVASQGSLILSNGGAGNGIVLRQSTTPPGKAEFVVGSRTSYASVILADNPTSYWRLDDSNSTAVDIKAQHAGAYQGGYTQIVSGALVSDADTAVSLNGTNGYINIATSFNLTPATSTSQEIWFKTPAGYNSRGGLIGFTSNGVEDRMLYLNSSGAVVLYSTSYYSIASAPGYNDGNWHHVVATIAPGAQVLYVDGVVAGTANIGSLPSLSPANLKMGFEPNGVLSSYYINATLDEAAVYSTILSAAQVLNHYYSGKKGPFLPGNTVLADQPVGYWRLNEASGVTAYDLSGSGNNGNYWNATLGKQGPYGGSGDNSTAMQSTATQSGMTAPIVTTAVTNVSFEAWAYPTSASQNNWIAGTINNPGSTPSGYGFFLSDGSGGSGSKVSLYMPQPGVAPGVANVIVAPQVLSLNTWHHLVATNNGTIWALYVDGASTGTRIGITPLAPALIGVGSTPSNGFIGNVAEVALYNYALSSAQVAKHYSGGNGAGWWFCQSKTPLNTANWNLLTALFDTTTGISQLYINGQQECSVTPSLAGGTSWSFAASPSTPTYAGSSPPSAISASNFWQGLMTTLKLFGTSGAAAPAPLLSANIASDFSTEANRFRATPVENSVTNGLIMSLDAANANQGIANYSSGCSPASWSWFDLSATGNPFNAALIGFVGGCATDGWRGTGGAANPYVLNFNGTSDYVVPVGTAANLNATAYTKTAWVNVTATRNNYILSSSGLGGQTGHALLVNSSNHLAAGHNGAYTLTDPASSNIVSGAWYFVAVTYDSAVNNGTLNLYKNGSSVATATAISPPTTTGLQIGAYNNGAGNYFTGSMATVQLYNRALTPQEIKQNCLAQEPRFTTGGLGVICGQP